jgi:hypothetical protein
MAPVLKTGIPERVSGVRIPPSPPDLLLSKICKPPTSGIVLPESKHSFANEDDDAAAAAITSPIVLQKLEPCFAKPDTNVGFLSDAGVSTLVFLRLRIQERWRDCKGMPPIRTPCRPIPLLEPSVRQVVEKRCSSMQTYASSRTNVSVK